LLTLPKERKGQLYEKLLVNAEDRAYQMWKRDS
jgi:hypothetical protein